MSRFPASAVRLGLLLTVAAIIGVPLLIWWLVPDRGTLADAEKLFLAGEFQRAEQLALTRSHQPDEADVALALAYRAALRDHRPTDAVAHVEHLADDAPQWAKLAIEASDLAIHQLHEFQRADVLLTRAIQQHPDDLALLERRAFLLGLTGRSTEAEPLRLALVRHGVQTTILQWLICLGDDALENTELLAEIDLSTDDPLTLFALARWIGERGDAAQARTLLRKAIERGAPVDAVVLAGRLAREAGDIVELQRLLHESETVLDSPQLWWLRGVWCEEQGQHREAIRCHAEAVNRLPNLSRSLIPLSRLLEASGQAQTAQQLRERAAQLALYLNAVKAVRQEAKRPQWERVMALTRALSLTTEAAGWWSMGRPEWKDDPALQETRAWLEAHQDTADTGRVPRDAHPLRDFDLSAYPLPTFGSAESPSSTLPPVNVKPADQLHAAHRKAEPAIRWGDVAAATGLDFVYGPLPGQTSAGHRMFEFSGGGVAVMDFDRDGWLDTWWTQGVPWPAGRAIPPDAVDHAPTDRLFRNRGGAAWDDVTAAAQFHDRGFGQGVAAGDLDGDGFAEIVVANIGNIVVHWNHGDGTFTTETLSTPGGWATSLALADLTTDGLPDIYVACYLGGPEIFTRTCPDAEGHPHSCLPQHFPAQPDFFLRNHGNGTFADETAQWGFTEADGKGLGIAVADFTGDGQLDLFVANDTTANFCWVQQPEGQQPRFLDEGLARGLALNGDGRAQADMGIALDDIDGNGLFYLLVTKFFNEANTLSLQTEPGFFVDATGGSGLGDSSLRLLGFGTRFLDADLDGRPDVIITNGHIDDARHRGEPYAMRPQFYRNLGRGHFRELFAKDVGPFFDRESLGRGMAKGDWNHDGREDVFISHIGSPAALLENRTTPAESTAPPNWLSLELVGVHAPREPVGAKVELTTGPVRYTKVLSAGGGYQSSDPASLTFGLGDAQNIDDVTITWPGGKTERITGIASGQRWLIVEGRGMGVPLP